MEGQEGEREWLRQADHEAHRDFDKAIMTLAAGALGLSIAFVHNVAPKPEHTGWLAAAWVGFSTSLLFILASFLTSQAALRIEMKVLSGERDDPKPGGRFGTGTFFLNLLSAAALLVGVVTLVVFALHNVKGGSL
ncbi:MAG: hypothetical protein M3P10_06780 [Actinomycetota bacterium]|nr:hypothetical protein [Actinomycetota bacterium]